MFWVLTEESCWLGGVDVVRRSVVGTAQLDTARCPSCTGRGRG
ncbi:MAG: hypothetical protein U0R68_16925 [Candidatus Nanopelagicales bacterium]